MDSPTGEIEMMRRIAFLVLLCGFVALAADEALPKAETILDRFVEVTGGKEAYQKRKSEIATGTVEFVAQGVKGAMTRYSADPDQSYTVLDIEGVGKIEVGTSGGVAWEKSAILGPRVLSGEEKATALREGTLNAESNWRKLYSKVETAGVEMIDGEECYKVVLTPNEGRPETTYYQKKSGLAVKTNTVLVSQMGEVPVEVIVGNYKNFGGILEAARVTQKAAGQEVTRVIQNVKSNEEVPASRFDPPAEIKALLSKSAAPATK
jgi:zinc protease